MCSYMCAYMCLQDADHMIVAATFNVLSNNFAALIDIFLHYSHEHKDVLDLSGLVLLPVFSLFFSLKMFCKISLSLNLFQFLFLFLFLSHTLSISLLFSLSLSLSLLFSLSLSLTFSLPLVGGRAISLSLSLAPLSLSLSLSLLSLARACARARSRSRPLCSPLSLSIYLPLAGWALFLLSVCRANQNQVCVLLL